MSKYTSYASHREPRKKKEVHAIWRGIGLFLIVLIPVMSYLGTLVLLEENHKSGWVTIPKDMLSPYVEPMLYVKIALTLALMVVLYGIFSLISVLFYSAFAPPRYGPLDAPPIDQKVKRYKN